MSSTKTNSSPLLDLPLELLHKVLRYVLRSAEPIDSNDLLGCRRHLWHWSYTYNCSCSIIELSSQLLACCKTLHQTGASILYGENILSLTGSVKQFDAMYIYDATRCIHFELCRHTFSVVARHNGSMADPRYAQDIWAALANSANMVPIFLESLIRWRRLQNHAKSLFRIQNVYLLATYHDLEDMFVLCRSLRRVLEDKRVVFTPVYDHSMPRNGEIPTTQAESISLDPDVMAACKLLRCHSITLKHGAELQADGSINSDLAKTVPVSDPTFSEISSTITSKNRAPDLWKMWMNTRTGLAHSEDSLTQSMIDAVLRKNHDHALYCIFIGDLHGLIRLQQKILKPMIKLKNRSWTRRPAKWH